MAFARDRVSNNNVVTGTGNNTTFVTVTFNPLPASNSVIVVGVWNTSNDTPIVTDTSGNAYLHILDANQGNVSCHLFYTNYKLSLPGSAPLTLTATSSDGEEHFYGMQAASYTSSTPGTIVPDYSATNTSTGIAAAFQYGSGTPAQASELYVSAMGQNSAGSNEGVTLLSVSGQTGQYSLVGTPVNDGAYEVGGLADFISSDSTVRQIFWSWTANDAIPFASVIVPFRVSPFPSRTSTEILQATKRAALR